MPQTGFTLLHHAAQTNSVAVARLLVKCGADVTAKTRIVRPQPQRSARLLGKPRAPAGGHTPLEPRG